MKELVLASEGLNKIFVENVTFKKVLKLLFPQNSSDKKYLNNVSSLIGCELRHHLLFEVLLNKEKDNLSLDEQILVNLALANHFFLKRLDESECQKYVKEVLKDKYNDNIAKLFAYNGPISEIIDIDHNSIEYISIRFNTPTWLIKMWNKHFGKGTTFKILKANSTPDASYLRVSSSIANDSLFIDENKFIPSAVKDVYRYVGKEAYRHLEAYKNNKIITVKPIIKDLFDRYLDKMTNEFALYSGDDDSLVKEAYFQSNGEKGINLIVPEMNKRAEIMRFIRVNNIKNINFFMANDEIAYKTGISHPQDFFFLFPSSSSFAKIQQYPDFMYHFKRDSFDGLIAKQKEVLNDLAKFISKGGILIYMVDTLNKKESTSIVTNFLLDHQEFELLEEQQLFPFEKDGTAMYYAVMKLKEDA